MCLYCDLIFCVTVLDIFCPYAVYNVSVVKGKGETIPEKLVRKLMLIFTCDLYERLIHLAWLYIE